MEQTKYPGDDFAAWLISAVYPSLPKDEALHRYDELARSETARERLKEWADQDYGDPVLEDARRVLLPALLVVEQKHAEMPRQWPQVFSRSLATEDAERSVEVRGPGLPQFRPRGAHTARDNAPGERFIYLLQPQDIALATAVQKDGDDCWRDFARPDGQNAFTDLAAVFPMLMLGMAESFVQAEEIIHANALNTGKVYNASYLGDGAPLFGEHPIDDGVYTNSPTWKGRHVDLNETALEWMAAEIQKTPLQAPGVRAGARARKLVVPPENEGTAFRLFEGGDSTALHFYPEGYCVLDHLQDPLAWYVLTTIGGLRSIEKTPFKLDLCVDGNKLVLEGSHSYGCGYNNPRAIFGSFPTE
jgi:hypothetical protein